MSARDGVDTRDKRAHDGGNVSLNASRSGRPRGEAQPAIGCIRLEEGHPSGMRGGWVYIVTNRPNGTLYIGVTASLSHRIHQHRTGATDGFTKRYGLNRLAWYEAFDDIGLAIQREKTMKHWPRAWKVRLILAMNPDWADLYESLNA